MPPPVLEQEQDNQVKKPSLRDSLSKPDQEKTAPEHATGPQAAGNQAVQRLATKGVSVLEPPQSDPPLSSDAELTSRPSENQPAEELVSSPEEVSIHFDPKRPWLFSVTGTTDETAITVELYGEGLSVPLEKRKAVGFVGLVPRFEDRYVVVPWLLRPYYVELFNQAFQHRETELDIEVKADATEIKRLIAKNIGVMRMIPIPPIEERVITAMRHWANEPFPYRISDIFQDKPSGRYLDKLLLHLSDAYVEKGLFVDTWTNYHSLILNHFRRADEVKAIQDQHARVFAGERAILEAPGFFDILWEDVKSGAVASRIKNYFIGMGQAGLGLLEGLHTLITDPGKVIEGIVNLPHTLKALWNNKDKLWNQFLSASPNEQARMIGRLFGEAEIAIATFGAGGGENAALKAPELATATEVVGMTRSGAAVGALPGASGAAIDLGQLGGETGRLTMLMAQTTEAATEGKAKADELASEGSVKEKQPKIEPSPPKEASSKGQTVPEDPTIQESSSQVSTSGQTARSLELAHIEQLERRFPLLKKAKLRPRAIPTASRLEGAPEWAFEQRMQTTQGRYSLAGYNDKGKLVVEFDHISLDGWINETKIGQTLEKVDDIIVQLRTQSDFAKDHGLRGVVYRIEPPSVAGEVEARLAEMKLGNVYRE